MKQFLIAILMLLFSVPMIMYAQDGNITRDYKMYGMGQGNHVTLSFSNGNIESITIRKRLNQRSDSDIVCFYNTTSKNKNLQRELVSFSENLKRMKQKFIEWDSIAVANKIRELNKALPDINNNIDNRLLIDYTITIKGKNYYSYSNNSIGWIKSEGDFYLTLVPYYCINPTNKFMCFGWNLPNRVYVGSTQEPMLGGSYDTYKYYTTETYFAFLSPQELQSFIDALDIESAKRILLERNKNEKKVDDLFK